MERIERNLRGFVLLDICSAQPEALVNACLQAGIELLESRAVDACTLRVGVFENELKKLETLAQKQGCEWTILRHSGGSRRRALLRRRLALLIAAAISLGMLAVASLFLWEIRVVGGESISRGRVLRALEDCGVGPGSFWPGIDADAVRDQMLLKLPELAWMSLNLRGSTAQLELLERTEKPEIFRDDQAAELIASHTGIVRRVSALNGRAIVLPGQSVIAGETLISPSLESVRGEETLVRVRGEVWADTWYELTAICPVGTGKTPTAGRRGRLALTLGQKRINFYWGTGKAIDEYDKIIHEYKLGIKGVFCLPVGLVWEELRSCRETTKAVDDGEALEQRLLASLSERIDGEIVSFRFSRAQSEDCLYVTLRAQCLENIARVRELSQ